jgi:DNA-directed RNA polymerase delta subunit
MDRSTVPTKRDRLLDAAESVLAERCGEMHFTDLAELVYSRVGLSDEPAARLNGVLHDDSSGRFRRTGRGTWSLARWTAGVSK